MGAIEGGVILNGGGVEDHHGKEKVMSPITDSFSCVDVLACLLK